MNNNQKPEFDQYAASYTQLHRDNIKMSGEEPSYFAAYKANYMASKARPATHESPLILDFGCGVGNSIPHLANAFPKGSLHGVDPSESSIELARLNHGMAARLQVIANDRLPFGDGYFDLIHVACVLHHIAPARRAHWMKELRRVLKTSGHLFVFEHNVLNPFTRKAVNECPFDQDAILLPRRELMALTRGAQFKSVSCDYIVFFPRVLAALRPLENAIAWLPLGAQYVVHASA